MRALQFLILAVVIATANLAMAGTDPAGTNKALPPTIAIIIDDMGHNLEEGKRLANIDQPLTLAFLPYRPHTVSLAQLAYKHHKEIMLHAPMANTHHYGLGKGGLTPDMDEQAMTTTLRRALQSIPHVQGVNNHMGSLLTQQLLPMEWVMKELNHYPLYFVDSRTIASSVASSVANAYRVPNLDRDVFLDHEQTEEFLDKQFKLLIKKARDKGTAIAIAHPHKLTVDYLEKHLPQLDEQGIAIATISGLWAIRNDNKEMFAEGKKQAIRPAYAKKH